MKIGRDLKSLYAGAIEKYGVDAQLGVLQEECAELIVAVSHLMRERPDAIQGFIEELADVNIMTGQFIQYLENNRYGAEFWQATTAKLNRLHERLEQTE